MEKEHDKEEKISVKNFIEIISKFEKTQIETTNHTFFRINQKQRKIYDDNRLKDYLLNKRPIEIERFKYGLLYN